MNYYDILGIPHNASQDEIKKAYREQIKFFHPDVFDGPPEVARIKSTQLNEAYETLKDPEKRRAYDFKLWAEEQARRKEGQQGQHSDSKEQKEKNEDDTSKQNKSEQPHGENGAKQEATSGPVKRKKHFWQKGAPVAWALCVVLLITSLYFGGQFYSLKQQLSSPIAEQNSPPDERPLDNEEEVIRNPNIKNYVASKEGSKYHYLSCRYAKNISEENSIYFAVYSDAIEAGYEPCSVCNPMGIGWDDVDRQAEDIGREIDERLDAMRGYGQNSER